jgi:hypothetical protein
VGCPCQRCLHHLHFLFLHIHRDIPLRPCQELLDYWRTRRDVHGRGLCDLDMRNNQLHRRFGHHNNTHPTSPWRKLITHNQGERNTDHVQLQMPRHQRFGVAFLFGMGIIVTVAGIVRTW